MADDLLQLTIGISLGLLSSFSIAVYNVTAMSQKTGIRPIASNSIKIWATAVLMLLVTIFTIGGSSFSVPLEATVLLALSAFLVSILGDTMLLTSQERIGVSFAAPIAGLYPIFTYFILILFLGEEFFLTKLLGVILAITGVFIISRDQFGSSDDSQDFSYKQLDKIGILLALCTAILLAAAGVLIQISVAEIDPIHGNLVRMVCGSIMIIPLFTLAQKRGKGILSISAARAVALASFFGWSIGSLLWVITIKNMGATVASVLGSTSPLFAVGLSILILNEQVTRRSVLGTLLVVSGVWLVILGL